MHGNRVFWLFNVTTIFQLYNVTAHKCAAGLKNKLDAQLGSQGLDLSYGSLILNSRVEICVTCELRSVINLWLDIMAIPHTKKLMSAVKRKVFD